MTDTDICGVERIVSLTPMTLKTLVCAVAGRDHVMHWQGEELDGVWITYAWRVRL